MNIFIPLEPGTPHTGLWCAQCNLPSGVMFPIAALTDDGVAPGLAEFFTCTECYE